MESSESSPGTPSRDSADSPPTVATWTTSPDVSLLDVALDDDGSGASPAASLSARREEYVLVTGGLGFIGSHTVVELVKAGYNVIIVDDLSNSYRSVLDGILEIARRHHEDHRQRCPMVEMHQVSYRDLPAMRSILELHSFPGPAGAPPVRSNIVGVIHLAAYKAVEESIRHPLRYYQNNINGLVDLVALLGEFAVKTFIFSSSAARAGTETGAPSSSSSPQSDGGGGGGGGGGITNPYGRTKFFAEAILSDVAAADASWRVVVLRYFNPVGCDASGLLADNPRGVPSNLVPVVTQVMTGQRAGLRIYGGDWDTRDGTAVRDFIHVSDLARGHTAALEACRDGRVDASYRTYNLGTGEGSSVLDVVRAMEAVSGRDIPRETVARRDGDVAASVAAVDRARRELCWETEKTLLDACYSVCSRLNLLPCRAGGA
ncbi:UDP-glucose 4-epimerase family protein [Metarhizium robertsii]|uniref:UDP-glucose 4-epimerase family protein n=1 Tax=Metarhizium robertsii TaxID=568076 RepID=A0A0A1UP04_9HYPO|nr:UDP-glucose 4-epimerase family protein [Metarhizium robertsii]